MDNNNNNILAISAHSLFCKSNCRVPVQFHSRYVINSHNPLVELKFLSPFSDPIYFKVRHRPGVKIP